MVGLSANAHDGLHLEGEKSSHLRVFCSTSGLSAARVNRPWASLLSIYDCKAILLPAALLLPEWPFSASVKTEQPLIERASNLLGHTTGVCGITVSAAAAKLLHLYNLYDSFNILQRTYLKINRWLVQQSFVHMTDGCQVFMNYDALQNGIGTMG